MTNYIDKDKLLKELEDILELRTLLAYKKIIQYPSLHSLYWYIKNNEEVFYE